MGFVYNEITAPKMLYPTDLENSANGHINIISLDVPRFISHGLNSDNPF